MPISTAKNGIGQQIIAIKPLGLHYAVEKFGTGMPENAVLLDVCIPMKCIANLLLALPRT